MRFSILRQMRFSILLLVIALVIAPTTSIFSQTPSEASVARLKEEISKFAAIDRDGSVPPDVRILNRIFLKQRRNQLRGLLQKNIEGLRRYLSMVEPSLSPEEKLILQNTVTQAEKDLESLGEETEATVSKDDASRSAQSTKAVNTTLDSDRSVDIASNNGNGNRNGTGQATPVIAFAVTPAPPSTTALASQPQGSTSFNAALNARIRAKALTLSEARVDQTDNTKQTDTPTVSGGSGSLVDQSSASDLIGLAANFAGLSASSNDDKPDASSVSVTTSAYALLAAIKRVDPLNPVFYNDNREWRKFSLTLGYDDEDQPNGTKQRAKIFGGKFMFINRRDPGIERNRLYIEKVGNSLEEATKAFGNIAIKVRAFVMSMESVRRDLLTPGFRNFLQKKRPQIELDLERANNTLSNAKAARDLSPQDPAKRDAVQKSQETVNSLEELLRKIDAMLANPGSEDLFVFGPNSLPTPAWSREELEYRTEFENEFLGPDYRDKLSKETVDAVDEFIDRTLNAVELKAFTNLGDVTRGAVEQIRRAPQFSVGFLTKQRRVGIDEYLGELIFDYGVANRVNLTLNGAYRYNDSKIIGGDVRGFSFSGQLQFQLNRENLLGKKPLFLDVSTQGNWMNNVDAIYKAQGKLTIPIADGIDFPVSVTYANRTDLINEREVRGQFGFTLDTARLIRAFLFR